MNKQDYILKLSDFFGPVPQNVDDARLHRERLEKLKTGYRDAANEASWLAINPNDPHKDIHERLGLVKAAKRYMSLRMKTQRSDKLETAYYAGRVFALKWLQEAFFDTALPDEYKDWQRFHTQFVKPWAHEVNEWAKQPSAESLPHPPSILTRVQQSGTPQTMMM